MERAAEGWGGVRVIFLSVFLDNVGFCFKILMLFWFLKAHIYIMYVDVFSLMYSG